MISYKFLYDIKVHQSISHPNQYLCNIIELHRNDLALIDFVVNSKEINNENIDDGFYNAEVKIEITVSDNKDFFDIKSGLFFILSSDSKIKVLQCQQLEKRSINRSSVESNPIEENPLFDQIKTMPFPLALVISEYIQENESFIKLHRLIDAAELLTRFVAMILLSDVLRQHGKFPKALRKALVERIERPSFGAWKDLCRQACESLPKPKKQFKCFVRELPAYVQEKLLPTLGSSEGEARKDIIALRNLLAHGGRLPESQAKELLDYHKDNFDTLVSELTFLKTYLLVACTTDRKTLKLTGLPESNGSFPNYDSTSLSESLQPEHIVLVRDSEMLDLFPLHGFSRVFQWRGDGLEYIADETPQLYYRLNNNGYLEFTTFAENVAFSQQRNSAFKQFQKIYRLKEWQQLIEAEQQDNEYLFDDELRELTEVFVGREKHVQKIKECLKAKKHGVIFLSGTAGVGKSAVMAKLVKDYRNAAQHYLVIPYFFRIGHTGCSTDDFLKTAIRRLHTALDEAVDISIDPSERRRQLLEAVQRAEARNKTSLGKRILFIVDGLDEIDRIDTNFISLPYEAQAPNVTWLCAGRSEPGLVEKFRSGGTEWIFPDGLPNLDAGSIRAMLTSHIERLKYQLFERDEQGSDDSVKLSNSQSASIYRNRFVDVLVRKSEGLPLYMRMIIEDLRKGKWTLSDEDNLPDGLTAYFEQILERLKVDSAGGVLTTIFAVLVWAKEPVTEKTLMLLLSDHHLSRGSGWDETFSQAMKLGHIMLRASRTTDGEKGWAFYHDSFRNHLMTAERIKPDREWAQEKWLHWCADWSSLQEDSLRHYALRHYTDHLLDAKHWENLFALARDETFRQAQANTFHDDPGLQLMTVQAALLGAAEIDDASAMAEFMLAHAQRLSSIIQESPLDILQRTGSLERAWRVADLYDTDRRVLWYLVLAWCLKEPMNRIEDTELTLQRLMTQHLEELWDWSSEIAGHLLINVVDINSNAFHRMYKELLNSEAQREVCNYLLAKGYLTIASQLVETIDNQCEKAKLYGLLATTLAQAGQVDEAKTTITSAVHTLNMIDLPAAGEENKALVAIATAQAQIGQFQQSQQTVEEMPNAYKEEAYIILATKQAEAGQNAQALQVAEMIDTLFNKVKALNEIARVQVQAGQIDLAHTTVNSALQTSEMIPDNWYKSLALTSIADIQIVTGQKSHAHDTFAHAIRMAENFDNAFDKSRLLGQIAAVQFRAGMNESATHLITYAFEIASTSMENCEPDDKKDSALEKIASIQAQAGKFQEAIQTVELLDWVEYKVGALINIASLQTKFEQHRAAQTTYAKAIRIKEKFYPFELKVSALNKIAIAQALDGKTEAARFTFTNAVTAAKKISIGLKKVAVLISIAKSQAKVEHLQSAKDIFGEAVNIIEESDNTSWRNKAELLTKIASVQHKVGLNEIAMISITLALRAAKRVNNITDNRDLLLTDIASTQAKIGDLKNASHTLDLCDNKYHCPWSMLEIIKAHLQIGQVHEAFKFVERLGDDDQVLKAYVLAELASQQEEAGETDLALISIDHACRILSHSKYDSNTWDTVKNFFVEIKRRTLFKISVVQNRLGKTQLAVQTTKMIDDSSLKSHALGIIAFNMAVQGQFQQSFYIIESIEEEDAKLKTLVMIARVYARNGQKRETKNTFTYAIQLADESDNELYKIDISSAQIQTGFAEDAMKTAMSIPKKYSGSVFPKIAQEFVAKQDKEHFIKFLLPCASSLDAAYKMCGLLAQLYPEQASAVAEVVSN